MSEVHIYGASDDLVEFDGAIREEFGAWRGWVGELVAPNGAGLTITAQYVNGGVWSIGVGPLGEGEPFPDWPLRFEGGEEESYTASLIIDIPTGTTIKERK